MVIYGGIYICTKCGATGARKLTKLAAQCKPPEYRGKCNIKAYAEAKAPAGYEGWPYKRIHHNDNISINNIQLQLGRLQGAYEQ